MSSDVDWHLGTNCNQWLSMVQCYFTSTETVRLIRTESPGRPPRLSHCSWTLPALPWPFGLPAYIHVPISCKSVKLNWKAKGSIYTEPEDKKSTRQHQLQAVTDAWCVTVASRATFDVSRLIQLLLSARRYAPHPATVTEFRSCVKVEVAVLGSPS